MRVSVSLYSEMGYCLYARMVYGVSFLFDWAIQCCFFASVDITPNNNNNKKQTIIVIMPNTIRKKSNHLDVNIFRSIFYYFKTLLQTD